MYKIVITGKTFPQVIDKLSQSCEIKIWEQSSPIPRKTLAEWLADADGLFSTMVPIDDELLANAPSLRVIAQSSVGFDNINLEACIARNIPVSNTPGVLVEATADLAFGLVLNAARRIPDAAAFVKNGLWTKTTSFRPFGVDLYGKTLGIVGMGNIGAAAAKRAQASGMKVIYSNRRRREDDEILNAGYVSFDQLLKESDFVLVLAPLSEETRGLFGRAQFAAMKTTAYFINAARGAIVNTDALYQALLNGDIAYAALDVTDPEPLSSDHPLLTLPNILITPHIGSATTETRLAMAMLAADNLIEGLNRRPLLTCINPSVNYKVSQASD